MIDRAILTPKNDDVEEINRILIDKLPGPITSYYCFDETIDSCQQGQQEDFLNSLTPNDLPPHELELKLNCPIDPIEGLYNGTRLICCAFQPNVIDAKIVVGDHREKRVFIPRIPLKPSENAKYPFPFKRTQFPIHLMTINKAQDQTLNSVGIYLPQSIFAHGQLYVALSKAKTANSVKLLIRPRSCGDSNDGCTRNVVYQEVLKLAKLR